MAENTVRYDDAFSAPIRNEVTRRLDGGETLWSYAGNFVARLERVGGPDSAPPDA